MTFDAQEATVSFVHHALFSGTSSCRDIVEAFIARIEIFNPTINAVISINPNVLEEADCRDERLAAGQASGMLFGVPILIKDNFDSVGMPTSAGSLALRDCWPAEDADVVTSLRGAGAIILGKTNLHEFALEGLSVSSLGGQTINPYDFTRTPGGSSGGSGAAVAASFCVVATGSDTMNSLRSPASANSLYSFRPTPGLISHKGVVPVSSTQDSIGMIGRTLLDIAISFKAMSMNASEKLDQTQDDGLVNTGSAGLSQVSTEMNWIPPHCVRVGVLQGFMDTTTSLEVDPVNYTMNEVQSRLQEAGVTLIPISSSSIPSAPTILSTMDLQVFEIQDELDRYLSSPNTGGNHPQSFADLFTAQPNSEYSFLVIPQQYKFIRSAFSPANSKSSPGYAQRKSLISKLKQTLQALFHEYDLTCLIYPQQRNLVVPIGSPSQSNRNGILAAVTGCPAICIPAGFSPSTSTAPIGVPIGMEVLGLPGTDEKLFAVAKMIDDVLGHRRKAPVLIDLGEEREVKRRYERVPEVRPLGLSNVDLTAYPPGRI